MALDEKKWAQISSSPAGQGLEGGVWTPEKVRILHDKEERDQAQQVGGGARAFGVGVRQTGRNLLGLGSGLIALPAKGIYNYGLKPAGQVLGGIFGGAGEAQAADAGQNQPQDATQTPGGAANAAENTEQPAPTVAGQPIALTEQAKSKPEGQAAPAPAPTAEQQTGQGMMKLVREIPGRDGQPSIGVYQGEHGLVYQMGTPGQPGSGSMQVYGKPQAAQTGAQPRLGLNGIGNYNIASRAGGGYSFQGNAADAARFGAPVFRPGYTPQTGENLTFLEMRRRAQEPQSPSAPDFVSPQQFGWGWKGENQRRQEAYNNEWNQYKAGQDARQQAAKNATEAALGFGRQALERQRLNQTGQELAARMQGQQLQNAQGLLALQQAGQLRDLRQRWLASNDPAERQQLQEQIAVLSGQGLKEQERGRIYQQTNPVTGETVYVRDEGDTMREVPMMAGQGGGNMTPEEYATNIKDPKKRKRFLELRPEEQRQVMQQVPI